MGNIVEYDNPIHAETNTLKNYSLCARCFLSEVPLYSLISYQTFQVIEKEYEIQRKLIEVKIQQQKFLKLFDESLKRYVYSSKITFLQFEDWMNARSIVVQALSETLKELKEAKEQTTIRSMSYLFSTASYFAGLTGFLCVPAFVGPIIFKYLIEKGQIETLSLLLYNDANKLRKLSKMQKEVLESAEFLEDLLTHIEDQKMINFHARVVHKTDDLEKIQLFLMKSHLFYEYLNREQLCNLFSERLICLAQGENCKSDVNKHKISAIEGAENFVIGFFRCAGIADSNKNSGLAIEDISQIGVLLVKEQYNIAELFRFLQSR